MTNGLEIFLKKDFSSAKFWTKQFQDFCKFIYFVKQGILNKYCFQRAAGMAYSSLFAMVPMVVVLISIFSSIKIFPVDLRLKIESFLLSNLIPATSQRLNEKIAHYIQGFSNSAATIGLIGSIFMVFSVVFLLNTIENTFNSIMYVRKTRSVLHKFAAYSCILIYAPCLIGLSFILQKNINFNMIAINEMRIFYHYALIALAFSLMYKFIPNIFVSFRSAFTGGIWALVLIQIAHKSFSNFISTMVNYDKIYGALGTIPLFLIWLFMFWVVVLIGMEVTYVSNNKELLYSKFSPVMTDDYIALKVLENMGKTYNMGKEFETIDSLTYHINSSKEKILLVIDTLLDYDILAELGNNRYVLTKKPEYIKLFEILSLFFDSFKLDKSDECLIYIPLKLKSKFKAFDITLDEWLKK